MDSPIRLGRAQGRLHFGQVPAAAQGRADNEFLIPIHEFARFSDSEVAIIDHPAFQRLFIIQQLAQTDLVYRGATHKRGEHSLGAVAAVQLFIDALDDTASRPTGASPATWRLAAPLTVAERAFVRLAALLHDIGHIVAGHTLEDELGLLGHHDAGRRLNYVLDRRVWGGRDISKTPIGETLRERIDRLYAVDAETIGASHEGKQLSASDILLILISKDHAVSEADIELSGAFRLRVLRDMVGNTICADLLDYLHRDWQHIGKPRHFDKRLLHYFEMRESGTDTRLVVNLQSSKPGRYRSDAVTAILDLLESRYQLWEIALMHRTRTAAASMLERAIAELADEAGYFDSPERQGVIADALLDTLFEAADTDLLRLLADDLERGPLQPLLPTDFRTPVVTEELLWNLRFRILSKQVALVTSSDVNEQLPAHDMFSSADQTAAQRLEAAKARLVSVRELEMDFGLPPGALTMYCAPFGIGAKVAEVQVLHRDGVASLEKADRGHELTGGHLTAQVQRFTRLWRAALFVRPRELVTLERLDLTDTLAMAFRAGVLRVGGDSMRTVARLLASTEGSPHFGKQVLNTPALAARTAGGMHYPSGSQTARSYLAD